MGTNFIQDSFRVGQVKTTRTISITSAAAQLVTLLTSGAILVNFQNVGTDRLTLGDSAMLLGSGDTVFPFASREFYPVSDNFFTYARASSIVTILAVTEYQVG